MFEFVWIPNLDIIRRWGAIVAQVNRFKPVDRFLQTFLQRYLWLPLQFVFGQRDIGATACWIVLWKRAIYDL